MRDPKRIPRLLKKLRAFWEQNPDLRLGQIVENLAAVTEDYVFYIEDDVLESRIPEVVPQPPSQVARCAERLGRRLAATHPDDLGDGMRRDIQELLRVLEGGS